jgi:hypothetical protein
MALDRIVDPPRRGLMRRKPTAISLADRARDAGQWGLASSSIGRLSSKIPSARPFGFNTVTP